MCQAAHYGYVITGKVAFRYADGTVEEITTGEAYVATPATPPSSTRAPRSWSSPTPRQLNQTMAAVTANMEAVGGQLPTSTSCTTGPWGTTGRPCLLLATSATPSTRGGSTPTFGTRPIAEAPSSAGSSGDRAGPGVVLAGLRASAYRPGASPNSASTRAPQDRAQPGLAEQDLGVLVLAKMGPHRLSRTSIPPVQLGDLRDQARTPSRRRRRPARGPVPAAGREPGRDPLGAASTALASRAVHMAAIRDRVSVPPF